MPIIAGIEIEIENLKLKQEHPTQESNPHP